ncbi:carbon-nitrogen hydrolase family protein [Lujinxingia sediminis]|uniref:Carbon-nitrogen hydrolase family protein n=1 Tax=Lujinxingia sediminis TaxID=2480984 RepID=A0ABY0CXK5_9DELT|nr:carbon-nitrogen hydrolase family protein [Lujinxingia sediminis]RVU48349.1 carbon-nitrogen hydrolase family protein [Lujinxingia sediminis]
MRVALAQIASTRDIEDNLRTCGQLAESAAEQGAGWVIFPECAPFLGPDRDKLPIAEPLDGPQIQTYQTIARELGVYLTVGSFAETSPDPTRTFNTQIHLTPDGAIAAIYRKIHLFDAKVDGDLTLMESKSVMGGRELVLTDVLLKQEQARVGLTICYDLRFPEIYRELALRGAEMLTVPSAFTLPTGRAHWHTLLRARAIENQCFVLAPNQWGHHYGSRASFGNSVIYDPWGDCLGCLEEGNGVVLADLNLERQREIRQSMPVLTHQRLGLRAPDADEV